MDNEFIKENKKFWSQFKIKNGRQRLLIEEPAYPPSTHINAIFAMILNQAKGYLPVWLHNDGCQKLELLQSYFPNAEIVKTQKKSLKSLFRLQTLYVVIITLVKFLKIYFTEDILGFRYDGVNYGDILYDTYLKRNQVATIKKIDYKIIRIIAHCILRHIEIKHILQNGNYAAVLVSWEVGISSGVMLRTAIRYGYQGYLCCGHHKVTFQCFRKPEEVYDWKFKPFPLDIDHIITQLGPNLYKVFSETLEKEVTGKSERDDRDDAFSKDYKYYTNRIDFNRDYKLDPEKKNVFIMLHALNDYPHSCFRWMIFKDYYDWFIQTLKFAKNNNRFNWIFKQHPSIRHYPVKDISFKKLFVNCPNNIVYISEHRQIDTRSLIYCADLVVTCVGSAGFELPAMAAIPSVTAGDNFYTQLSFALEPKNKQEYFSLLRKADEIGKLTPEQQRRARAAYLFIYEFCRVNISICFPLSMDEIKDRNIDSWYWTKTKKSHLYDKKGDVFKKELRNYIKEVAKPDFKRLTSLNAMK